MIKSILKRDGRRVPFSIEKISNAVAKALQASNSGEASLAFPIAVKVAEELEATGKNEITVEEIQDTVERVLMQEGLAKTAKAYILYRRKRSDIREGKTQLMEIYDEITNADASDSNIKRENANIDGDTAMGTMLKYGSEGAKQYNLSKMIDPEQAKAHLEGDIHIHDLDFYTLTTTCCQIDLSRLFHGGFSTGHGFLREPNSIGTAAALACITIQANQNEQHGGQSVPNFDYSMAPYVQKSYLKAFRQKLAESLEIFADAADGDADAKAMMEVLNKDGKVPSITPDAEFDQCLKEKITESGVSPDTAKQMVKFIRHRAELDTEKATFQAMEGLIHNLNTMHSRAGAQIPFSSLNYGTDTSPEGRLVIRSILLATENGLGKGETPIFPIQIFKVKEGINYNPEETNYDLFKLACRVSAKRLFPNFSFLDAPFNAQYYKENNPATEVAYMGCRTRVMANAQGRPEITYGRGNLSFTSVNLPRIAIEAQGNVEWFFSQLDRKVDLVFRQLLDRMKIQCNKKVRNYPFLMGQGIWLDADKLNPDDNLKEVLKHGTLTVGFIGLAEALVALCGKHHGQSEQAQQLGLRIVRFMRDKADAMTDKTGLNFSLIATPAEGLSGRFVRMDRQRYGSIPGVTDRDYYTNSFHVPVYYDIPAFNKIQLEGPYHALTNGGHITYIELDGDPSKNLDAYEAVVRCMKENGIGYGAINHPVDRDPVCGYNGIIDDICPGCGRSEGDGKPDFERIRRITGYLVGTLDRFNDAKRHEVEDRVKHSVSTGAGNMEQI